MSIDIYPDERILNDTKLVVVDIRTENEWIQTGILPNAQCVTFFDARGGYDVEAFLRKMDELGGKDQLIGLICRTGSRTAHVAQLLHRLGYNARNLAGGVMRLRRQGIHLVPFIT